MEGKLEPGLERGCPPAMDADTEYAGVLYGLIPVVISATLGSIGGPPVIGIPIPCSIPIPPYMYPSDGEVGSPALGMLCRRAAIERVAGPSR